MTISSASLSHLFVAEQLLNRVIDILPGEESTRAGNLSKALARIRSSGLKLPACEFLIDQCKSGTTHTVFVGMAQREIKNHLAV